MLLLGAGLVGAAMRWYYPAPSPAHDMGTLLMVMWVPAVGNFIGYLLGRWRLGRRPPPGFDAAQPFAADARVELGFESPKDAAALAQRILLLIDQQVFSARCLAAGERGTAWTCDLQFFAPDAARSHFSAGTRFHVVEGTSVIGTGRILELRSTVPANLDVR